MNLRRIALCGAVIALGLSTQAFAKDWKTVTVTTEGAFAPWNLTDPSGKIVGFEPDLLAVLCKDMKIECKMETSDFDGMIPALVAGKYDVIMDSLSITDERKKTIDFTIPYAQTPVSFATTADSPLAKAPGTGETINVTSIDENPAAIDALKTAFKGKTIGVMAGTNYAAYAHQHFGDVAEIREYKNGADRDMDLQMGRIDLGFDDVTYFTAAFKANQGTFTFTGPEIAGTVWGAGMGFGIRKEDSDLKEMFNTALKKELDNGTVSELSKKWFDADISPAK